MAAEDQVRVLSQLANQDELCLAFYGDDRTHGFTKVVMHDRQQWQYLDERVGRATRYWQQLPSGERDLDRAKAESMSRFVSYTGAEHIIARTIFSRYSSQAYTTQEAAKTAFLVKVTPKQGDIGIFASLKNTKTRSE